MKNDKINADPASEIQKWWAENPMTYGDDHGKAKFSGKKIDIGSREFFDKLDSEFYTWNQPLHGNLPFDRLFPFNEYPAGSKVLEVGCGLGTMAMNWAQKGVSMTAVDLNPVAIEQTRKRFRIHGLDGRIEMANGNELPFNDGEFDYVYSWGVLHHSPALEKSLSELMRVTRSGGGVGVMLYNRKSLAHWYVTEFIEGFLHFENQFLGPLELASRYGDGYREEGNPHTWPVTQSEMETILGPYVPNLSFRIFGTELDGVLPMLWPGLGMFIPRFLKKTWARRFGWSLWMQGHKL